MDVEGHHRWRVVCCRCQLVVIDDGDRVGRVEGMLAMVEHDSGEFLHDRFGLCVEVSEHGVGVPAPEELDDIGVDVAAQ